MSYIADTFFQVEKKQWDGYPPDRSRETFHLVRFTTIINRMTNDPIEWLLKWSPKHDSWIDVDKLMTPEKLIEKYKAEYIAELVYKF